MSYSFVNSTSKAASNGTADLTTDNIDTTGANFLAFIVAHYQNPVTSVVDSFSNTWHARTVYTNGNLRIVIYYAENATCGANHNVTVSGGGSLNYYPAVVFMAFSGGPTSGAYDVENGGSGSSPLNTGSVTPSQANSLVIAAFDADTGSAISIDSGFTATTVNSGGSNEACGGAYLIQTSASAVNPAWTWTGGVGVAAVAVFKPAGGGGGGVFPFFLDNGNTGRMQRSFTGGMVQS